VLRLRQPAATWPDSSTAGLLSGERNVRYRLFHTADPAVAAALEALSTIAPARPVRTLRVSEAIRPARTCYDHLAGRLGVQLSDALEQTRIVVSDGDGFALGPAATSRLGALGIDVEQLSRGRRPLRRAGASAGRTSPVPWAPPWPTACSSSVGCSDGRRTAPSRSRRAAASSSGRSSDSVSARKLTAAMAEGDSGPAMRATMSGMRRGG
jgi:hypothetical protein